MKKKLRRAYLYLGNRDYGRIEAELNMYVACFLFGRDFKPNQIQNLEWDMYVMSLSERTESSIWDTYHVLKCAQCFSSRLFIMVDQFTWGFFDTPLHNMILMDQPNWPNIVNNHLEVR